MFRGVELFDLQDVIDAAAENAASTITRGFRYHRSGYYHCILCGTHGGISYRFFPSPWTSWSKDWLKLSNVNQMELGFDYTHKQKLQLNAGLVSYMDGEYTVFR